MKRIIIEILRPEHEEMVVNILEAFKKSGIIDFEVQDEQDLKSEDYDKNDEEILDLLDQADREKGVPYEELRKRFGL